MCSQILSEENSTILLTESWGKKKQQRNKLNKSSESFLANFELKLTQDQRASALTHIKKGAGRKGESALTAAAVGSTQLCLPCQNQAKSPSRSKLPTTPCSHSTCFLTQPHLYWSFGLALLSGSQNASHQTSAYLPKKPHAFPPWAPERKHTDNKNCSVYHKSSADLRNQQTLIKIEFYFKRLYFSMWEQRGSLKNRACNWVTVCGFIRS